MLTAAHLTRRLLLFYDLLCHLLFPNVPLLPLGLSGSIQTSLSMPTGHDAAAILSHLKLLPSLSPSLRSFLSNTIDIYGKEKRRGTSWKKSTEIFIFKKRKKSSKNKQ